MQGNQHMLWIVENTSTYYHGIFHPSKLEKICVVFDLNAEFHGTSINKGFLSGPSLTNQIVAVLLRFREEQIAVNGDVEAIYHQVKVAGNQRSFLPFLWKLKYLGNIITIFKFYFTKIKCSTVLSLQVTNRLPFYHLFHYFLLYKARACKCQEVSKINEL